MRFNLIFSLTILCMSGAAFTANSDPGVLDSSEFEVEGGLVDKIYEQNAKASQIETMEERNGWLVSAGLGFFNANTFSLTNPYFDVNYTEGLKALPAMRVSVAAPVGYWKGLELAVAGRVEYSYRESLYSVQSKTGASLTDSIRVHWLPVSAGANVEYEIPHFPFVKPSVGGGLGIQWVYQQGKLDGLEQGFWIPFSYLEAALTLLPSSDWFGGVRAGATLVQSFGDSQQIGGWSLDVGVQFRL